MNNVIYEAKAFYGINVDFLVFCIVTALMIILLIIFWKRVDIGVRCFISSIIAFFIFMISCQVYVAFDSKHKVYDKYKAGNYFTVEGTVNNYLLAEEGQPNLPDYFDVNGVEFSVPGFVSAWGYPLKSIDGGVLKNGMNVRIYYVRYKFENVIMKLEIID